VKKLLVSIFLTLTAFALCVIAVSCEERLPAEEGRCRLTYKSIGKSAPTIFLALQKVHGSSEKPYGLTDLPANTSGYLTYFMPTLGGKGIPVVLDSLRRQKLFLDTNADGRLSDEKVFKYKTRLNRFGPITLRLDGVEEAMQPKFYVCGDSGRLTFYPAGTRTGRIRLGSKTYRVKVTDGNLDGRYDTALKLPVGQFSRPGYDEFAIDLNRNRQFASYGHAKAAPLSRMVRVRDSYYNIDLAADGTMLELNKVDPNFGTLDLNGAGITLRLWSDAAHKSLAGSERSWRLPVGKYFALSVDLRLADSDKSRWTFYSRETGGLKSFEIRDGQTTVIEIGPPFSIEPFANRSTIGFEIVGQGGELYSTRVLKDGQELPRPKFEVVDESGEVLCAGTFENDRDGFCRYQWRVPNDFNGKYQIKIDLDIGPFEKNVKEAWFTID